jgi:SET domain-containing protein
MIPQTYVSNSQIHGNGLFAGENISKNTIIGWLNTVACQKDGSHVLWVDEKNGYEVLCDLKYINHSDNPNACYYDDLSVMAIHDIKAGEEITHNYDCREW